MGYRFYLGCISKKEHVNIQDLSYALIQKRYKGIKDGDNFHITPRHIIKDVVYELGTDVDFMHLKQHMQPFFKNKKTQDSFDGYDFWVVDKDFLEGIIENFRKGVLDFYKNEYVKLNCIYEDAMKNSTFLNTNVKENLAKMTLHLKRRMGDWDNELDDIYNLKEKSIITDSWSYEYAIFQLVYIYKTFNWEKNQLVFFAW